MSFLTEIKRRKVFQVAAVYAVVAWLLVRVVATIEEPLGLPVWFDTGVIVLLAIGFPIALILSWAFEITPEGLRTTSGAREPEESVQSSGHRLTYATHVLVLVAVGFLVLDQYVLESEESEPRFEASPTATSEDAAITRFLIDIGTTDPMGNTGQSVQVDISPDGRNIVYAAQVDGRTQAYLRDLGELTQRPIIGTDGAYHPFFSPDGQSIGFYSDATDHKLKSVATRGGPVQILADAIAAAGGDWYSRDGMIFATVTNSGQRVLYQLSGMAGEPKLLFEPDAQSGRVWPHMLPGGEAVIYVVRLGTGGLGNARDGRIELHSFETGETRTLIEGGFRPRYSPTGHIIFVRSSSLWAVPFDLDTLNVTGPEVPILQDVEQDGFIGGAGYAFSDNGTLVYVPGGDTAAGGVSNRLLVWVDREGSEEIVPLPPSYYRHPRISPDGSRLAVIILENGNRDLWIHEFGRSGLTRLTFDPSIERAPIWSPDGQQIIFSSDRNGGGIYRKAADGSGQVELIAPYNGITQNPEDFTPEADRFIVRRTVNAWDLYVQPLEGEAPPEVLLDRPADEFQSAISPSGRWIAYTSSETGLNEVFVQPFPSLDGKWQISSDGGAMPAWSSDGTELFYWSGNSLMVADISTTESSFRSGEPAALFSGRYLMEENAISYQVSADDQRFLMIKENPDQLEGSNAIVVVENWFSELQRLAPTN